MGKQIRKQKKSSIIAGGFFRLGVYLCVAIAVIYIGKSAYDFGYEIFNQEAVATKENGRDITVVLKKDDSVYQIGKILKKKGLIKDAKIFVVQEKLQAGTYILNTSMTPDEMMAILARENTEGQPDQTDASGAAKEGSSDIESESENASDEGGAEQ